MGALVPDVLDGQVSANPDGTADPEGWGHRHSMGRVSREGSPFR